jgi:adenylate cyclase
VTGLSFRGIGVLRTERRRDFLAALLIAFLAGAIVALPQLDRMRGLSIDVLTWLKWRMAGQLRAPESSPTVVIALDEETYRRKPFEGTPNVTWTREIGLVLDAVLKGGAKVVGFDIIFPTSIEQSEMPFESETLGARVRGFDRDFLRVLAQGARAGKVVLGQVQHQDHPIQPAPGQRIAVRQQANIRALNFHIDPDDVVRRVPLSFIVDGETTPSMSVELAARALGARAELSNDGRLTLAGHRVAGRIPNTLTLNFEGGADDIPTYSLADLRECAVRNDAEFFRREFEGRVVLIGAVLDLEDRSITSKRFATGVPESTTRRCALPPLEPRPRFSRNSIPGVYVHATAVNNLIRREELKELNWLQNAGLSFAIALAASGVAVMLTPALALAAFGAVTATWTAVATWAFTHAHALPLIEAIVAGMLAIGITIAHRFVIADKDKRLLRRNFALYLPPAVIDRMLASSKPPTLGGETRDVTVYFSDLVGFSTFSERLAPSELVSLINEYLTAMTDVIEAHGGFVDKFIGDGIVAVFGAPVDEPEHALHAIHAALDCQKALEDLNRRLAIPLRQRIGLNTGPVLVGNLGSKRRFNYTVMGDTVNLASRLESANRYYGTSIIASESTMAAAGEAILWRELDTVRVSGRSTPVRIFEPLGVADAAPDTARVRAASYSEALARWRARDFAGAEQALAGIAARDEPASRLLGRARAYAAAAPGQDWEAVTALEGK